MPKKKDIHTAKDNLRIVSLFSGCGGLDLGFTGGFSFYETRFDKLPIDIVFANDFDVDASTCYNSNSLLVKDGTKCLLKDIREIGSDDIPDYKDKFLGAYPGINWEDNLMALPSNLSIIATMNTSDQSLYQMDSAFKRRWDMVYFPIKYDDADKAVLDLGNGKRYKWGDVLRVLNDYIKEETESPNKCIGNRFIDFERAGNKIDYRAFRDKVLFYLFTDVFKDSMDFAKDFFGEEKFGKGYKFFEDLCEHEKEGPAIIADFLQRHGLTTMPGSDEESASAPDASASETGSTSATSTDSEA